jgi:AraC-like DNA-binding protein
MKYKTFNSDRPDFEPYGLTCEQWIPSVMPKIDRHNEIELNYINSGTISYFFKDSIVTLPKQRITMFWGLVPHRIMDFENEDSYYVCTIPLAVFLKCGLPDRLVNNVLSGNILVDNSETPYSYDKHLFSCWEKDITDNPDNIACLLEIQARLLRFAQNYSMITNISGSKIPVTNKIEKMTFYIACHYTESITAKDIANSAGVTPDYANVLFNKIFNHSVMKQVMIERINHAQRELLFTDSPILQIALDCGFNSISCFNTAFRKLNNCSPTDYRRIYRKNKVV